MTLTLDDTATLTAPGQAPDPASGPRTAVAVGLTAIAVVHLVDLPGKSPSYLALLYVGLVAACAALAGLALLSTSQAVPLAAGVLAGAVMVAYVLTRTTGLPGAVDDIGNWAEPLGVAALASEAATLGFALLVGLVLARRGPRVVRTLRA